MRSAASGKIMFLELPCTLPRLVTEQEFAMDMDLRRNSHVSPATVALCMRGF